MGWKIYFWFILFLLVISYIPIFIKREAVLLHIWDLVVSVPSLAGLFCFAYKKIWLPASFWKIYFFVIVVWDLVFNLVITPKIDAHYTVLDAALGFGIMLPLYIGLYLYAYKFRKET